MLTQEQKDLILELLNDEIQGATCKGFYQIVDEWIDNNILTEEYFNENEIEFCSIFDNSFFECGTCGWTVPRDWESYCINNVCRNCAPDEEDEYGYN